MADSYSFNRAVLVGHVVKDPEFKKRNETKLCKLSLATNEIFLVGKGDNREPRKKVEYHNLIAWGKTAEIIYKYVKKGSLICVEGRLRTTSYTKEGEEKKTYFTQVEIIGFSFLGKISEGAAEEGEGEPEDDTEPEETPKKEADKDECPF